MTDVNLLQNKVVVALDCQPPLAGHYPAPMDVREWRVPSASLPQAFLLQQCGVPTRSHPCHLSNPTPAKRPVGDLSWLPPPGPQRPEPHRPDDVCHQLPQRMARASNGTQNPGGSFGVTSKIQMGIRVVAGLFQWQTLMEVTAVGGGNWP